MLILSLVTVANCVVRQVPPTPPSPTTRPWSTTTTASACSFQSGSVGGQTCIATASSACHTGVIQWNYPNYLQNPGACVFHFDPAFPSSPSSACYKLVLDGQFDASLAAPLRYDAVGTLYAFLDSNAPRSVHAVYVDGPSLFIISRFNGSIVYATIVDYHIAPVSCNSLPAGTPTQPQPPAPTVPACPLVYSTILGAGAQRQCSLDLRPSAIGSRSCAQAFFDDPLGTGGVCTMTYASSISNCFLVSATSRFDTAAGAYYDRASRAHFVFDPTQRVSTVQLYVRGPWLTATLDYAGSTWVSAIGFNVTFTSVDCSNVPSSVPQQTTTTAAWTTRGLNTTTTWWYTYNYNFTYATTSTYNAADGDSSSGSTDAVSSAASTDGAASSATTDESRASRATHRSSSSGDSTHSHASSGSRSSGRTNSAGTTRRATTGSLGTVDVSDTEEKTLFPVYLPSFPPEDETTATVRVPTKGTPPLKPATIWVKPYTVIVSEPKSDDLGIILGSTGGAVALFLLVAGLLCVLRRRRLAQAQFAGVRAPPGNPPRVIIY